MEKFLDFLIIADKFLPPIIEMVMLALTPILVGLVARALSEKHRKLVADIATGVFKSVEALASRTKMKSDDKLAEGLRRMSEELGKSLSKNDEAMARQTFERLAKDTKFLKPAD